LNAIASLLLAFAREGQSNVDGGQVPAGGVLVHLSEQRVGGSREPIRHRLQPRRHPANQAVIARLFRRRHIATLLDAPCGDFNWMAEVVPHLENYYGVDIVPELIRENQTRHQRKQIHFQCANLATDPLPRTDLVLCRDCFIHLSTNLIWLSLCNFKKTGTRYLLLSNQNEDITYRDIVPGSCRPINFHKPPFNFPKPLEVILEDAQGTRQLCLWELDKLNCKR
jgi:hypothetical protein